VATLAAIRAALQARLQTIAGLNVYDVLEDQMREPFAAILPAGPVEATYLVQGGADRYDAFEVIVVGAARANQRNAQATLDPYLASSGSSSIQAALEADQRLGGVVDFAVFDGWTSYGGLEIGDIEYIGARGRINVWHR
jgi:hypothetical protein